MESCGCNELPIISSSQLPPADSVEVVGEGNIVSTKSIGAKGQTVYTVTQVTYQPPTINTTANPIREVGTTNDFTWNGTIIQGTKPIVLREITPAGADLSGPFSVNTEDDTRSSSGFNQKYAIKVRDAQGTEVNKALGIQYYNKVYQWFSIKDGVNQVVTEDDILAGIGTLAASIKDVYGGVRNYAIPPLGALQHIYWAYESGSTPINAMTLSGLPFPIVFLPGSIPVQNPNNPAITTNFTVVRSTNKYGTTTLPITML
jgi:hypothetical protein